MLMSIPGAPVPFRLIQSVRYGKVPGGPEWKDRLFLDLLLPDTGADRLRPAVLYLHGGGWAEGERSAGLYPWLCPLLAAHGFVAASVGYRLSRFAPFPAQLYDVKAAVRFLRARSGTYGIDPDRIGVWGDSSGGHVAALLGTTGGRPDLGGDCGSPGPSTRVQAVLARCAPTDFSTYRVADDDWRAPVFARLFGGPLPEREELAVLASPVAHVGPGMPPFRLVHGTHDETVPYEQATRLAAALRAHGNHVEVRTFDGAHHNLLPDVDAPWGNHPWTELGEDAVDFFTRFLCTTRR